MAKCLYIERAGQNLSGNTYNHAKSPMEAIKGYGFCFCSMAMPKCLKIMSFLNFLPDTNHSTIPNRLPSNHFSPFAAYLILYSNPLLWLTFEYGNVGCDALPSPFYSKPAS